METARGCGVGAKTGNGRPSRSARACGGLRARCQRRDPNLLGLSDVCVGAGGSPWQPGGGPGPLWSAHPPPARVPGPGIHPSRREGPPTRPARPGCGGGRRGLSQPGRPHSAAAPRESGGLAEAPQFPSLPASLPSRARTGAPPTSEVRASVRPPRLLPRPQPDPRVRPSLPSEAAAGPRLASPPEPGARPGGPPAAAAASAAAPGSLRA